MDSLICMAHKWYPLSDGTIKAIVKTFFFFGLTFEEKTELKRLRGTHHLPSLPSTTSASSFCRSLCAK